MNINDMEYDKPVIVISGKHKGKIGYIDDEELPYVYIHFDLLTLGTKSCTRINIKNVRAVNHLDLVHRMEILKEQIFKEVSKIKSDYQVLFTLYEEYVYVSQLQVKYYINAFYLTPTIEKKIFISCSQADIILSNNIATDLKLVGYNVFLYSFSIALGENIIESISENIEKADILIPIISDSYISSQFCKDELTSFYVNHIKQKPNSILPIRLNSAQVPTIFASYKYFDYNNFNYSNCIEEILRAIKKLS